MFRQRYANVFERQPAVERAARPGSELFDWDPASTYIQEPPFLLDLAAEPGPIRPIRGARVLLALGDSVTTDHISPAGSIAATSPAGKYLASSRASSRRDFNSYGSRRGNDRVMTRGTFANIRIRNLLAPGTEGGVTRHLPDGELMTDLRRRHAVPGGRRAAGGPGRHRVRQRQQPRLGRQGNLLLGVRAVIAASFERIHRSNLVGMGVLPLELPAGTNLASRSA